MAYTVGGEFSSNSDPFNSTPNWKYDVFLSFAGKDTRLNFTAHLDEAFNRSGITTFRDDVDLEKGGDIKQGLFQAIQDSLCAVVVISENFGNSTWCLDELQKILESQKTLDRQVFPVFYDVDPADVRHQRKSFGKSLAEYEKKFIEDRTKVQNWKDNLCEIGNLSGWDTRGKDKADVIKKIVGDVWAYLSSKLPSYDDNHVIGIESRVPYMMAILEIGLDDRRFVGIWGMGGVGKTTLARVVFEKLSHKFEVCCFLANVRETLLQRKGLVSLQKRLLSHPKINKMEIDDDYEGMKMIRKFLGNKKVFLVLDDLDDSRQLKSLAESPNWFGNGSRIIITTRDSQLLRSSGVQRIYEMKTMNKDESLQLFSKKAFNKDHLLDEDYLKLSESVVEYTGGLPLALEVLGSFLCGRSKAEWMDALDRLKQIPDDDILQVLKISYNGLRNEEEKTIFLDIACFFKGWRKKYVTPILERCGLHPTIGIDILIQKTLLVETEDCRLEMHDLFQELGRNIVKQESPNDVGKRSRLWKFEDIKEVLEKNKGSKAIQAIVLKYDYGELEVHPEAFSKMSNIRLLFFLILGTETEIFDFFSNHSYFILPRGLKSLSGALKVVRWPLFPLEALPFETPLHKIVEIEMHKSKIKQLWNDNQFMTNLKFMDLRNSPNFTETPDFSRVPNLEHLRLSGCKSLVKVHPSLGQLKKLVEVYLGGCENLEILPEKLETNSLMKLDLSGCGKVAVLPEFGKGMKKLSYLDASNTAIRRLPISLGSLTGLAYLDLGGCKIFNLDEFLKAHITCQIDGLNVTSLTELYLKWCGINDGSIPDDFGSLSSLIVLDLSGNDFVNLPTGCFSGLSRLVFLSLDFCTILKSLPRLPPRLIRLNASNCDSMEPLSSDRQLWNLVASLDHECRGRTKYVIPYDEEEEPGIYMFNLFECFAIDFYAIIPGSETPSWFQDKEDYPSSDKRREYVIKVDIPSRCWDSKWCGIVVCFLISGAGDMHIDWSSKAAEDDDDDYIQNLSRHSIFVFDHCMANQCIMVLELNQETCWRHLIAHHSNSLHIKFSTYFDKMEIKGSGWRVICKEDIQEGCNLMDSNQLTQPQLADPDDELKLSWRMLRKFIMKLD